ncbi:hypothetical protein BC628DRAFT_981438 [Trametes gibbosa]|nr:hypothetical protein BC628DRAFT_981438 [Trametes gibbosa]
MWLRTRLLCDWVLGVRLVGRDLMSCPTTTAHTLASVAWLVRAPSCQSVKRLKPQATNASARGLRWGCATNISVESDESGRTFRLSWQSADQYWYLPERALSILEVYTIARENFLLQLENFSTSSPGRASRISSDVWFYEHIEPFTAKLDWTGISADYFFQVTFKFFGRVHRLKKCGHAERGVKHVFGPRYAG